MIDHIGTKRVSVRQIQGGVAIRLLDGERYLEMTAAEWLDLVGLVTAIKAAVDFAEDWTAEDA
jgi:hypothetical protein